MTADDSFQDVKIDIDAEATENSGHTNNISKGDITPHSKPEEQTSPTTLPNAEDNPYVVPKIGGAQLRIPPKVSLVPKPFGKIKHVIIVSYLSLFCCLVCGVYANQYAHDAKRCKELGLRGEAKRLAKEAVCCIYTSIVLGVVIFLFSIITFVVVYIKNNS